MFHGWASSTKTEQINTVIEINWWIDGLLGLALNACNGFILQNEICFCYLLRGMTITLDVVVDTFCGDGNNECLLDCLVKYQVLIHIKWASLMNF